MIYRIKKVPEVIKSFFEKTYTGKGFTFEYYWYRGIKSEKTYGCFVKKNGKMYSYWYQGRLFVFEKLLSNLIK